MYKLFFEDYPLYDPRGANKTDRLIIREPSVQIGVNMAGSISFIVDPGHPNADKITKMAGTLELQDDSGPIFRGRVLDSRETFYKSTQYTAEGAMAYLNDSIVEPYTFPDDFVDDPGYIAAAASGNVVEWWLGWLLQNHNKQVSPERQIKLGTVTVTDPNNYISRADSTYPTTFEVVREKLVGSRLGGYLIMRYERDGNYLDYISSFVQTNAQEITFAQNLLDLVRERSAADLYTAVLPVGADGLTVESLPDGPQENGLVKAGKIIYNPQAEADFGGRITRKVDYDDITLPQNLLHSAVMDMGGEIRLPETLEVQACDLHNLDGQTPSFRIGLYTVVVSTPHEIRKSYPLTELRPNILEPGATTITLNGTTSLLTSQIRRQQSTIVEGAIPYIEKAVQSATEQITGNKGGYVVWHSTTPGGFPEEILIMDTPDINTATKVWRWNKAGLGYSSHGYNGPYETAITQDGAIVADFITTGQLTASLIRTGILQSLDGDVFYLDLENGVLKMRADSLTIGGKTVEDISSGVAQDAVDAQTQEDIFNKLTGDGGEQGIYLQDGRLYINASYIQSGTISLELLKLIGTACGLMQGYGETKSGRTTEGIVMFANGVDDFGNVKPPYIIVTDAGIRGQSGQDYDFNMAGGHFEVNGDIIINQAGSYTGGIDADGSINSNSSVRGAAFSLSPNGEIVAMLTNQGHLQLGGSVGTYLGGSPIYIGMTGIPVYIRGNVDFSQAVVEGLNFDSISVGGYKALYVDASGYVRLGANGANSVVQGDSISMGTTATNSSAIFGSNVYLGSGSSSSANVRGDTVNVGTNTECDTVNIGRMASDTPAIQIGRFGTNFARCYWRDVTIDGATHHILERLD
nr:phage tail protein [uncultured Dysosmobacter sp.]